MNQIEEKQPDGTWKARIKLGSEHQAFSGIDLRKEADYPGVVFPLNIGHEISSFSSIIAHIDKKAKVVHSEYRLFIGTKTEKTYIKGRCVTLVRGYESKPLPRVVQPEPVTQKLIDKIFNLTPKQPAKVIQKEAKPMPSYILRDNLDISEGKEFLGGLSQAWDETDFEPDTDFIKKENLVVETPVVRVQQSLYNNWDDYDDDFYSNVYGNKKKYAKEEKKDKELSSWEKKMYIVDKKHAIWTELYGKKDSQINELYEEILSIEQLEEEELNIFFDTDEDNEETKESDNYSVLYNGNSYNSDQLTKIRFLLEEEEYLSFAKINQMTDINIIAYYENFYQKKIKGT